MKQARIAADPERVQRARRSVGAANQQENAMKREFNLADLKTETLNAMKADRALRPLHREIEAELESRNKGDDNDGEADAIAASFSGSSFVEHCERVAQEQRAGF
jgi:hypothetical protein